MYRGFRAPAVRKLCIDKVCIVRSFGSTPTLLAEKEKAETVTKESIARMIAEKHQLSLKESSKIVGNVLLTIEESLQQHKEVSLYKFGRFQSVVQKAMKARNPSTGEAVDVPEKMRVKFTASETLKNKVNGIEPPPPKTKAGEAEF